MVLTLDMHQSHLQDLLKHTAGSHPEFSNSWSGMEPETCISNKFLSDAEDAGLESHTWGTTALINVPEEASCYSVDTTFTAYTTLCVSSSAEISSMNM